MRRPLLLALLFAVAAAARPAGAQGRDNTIDPGMTKAQVIEHLGQPQSVKTSDTLTFLFYQNGCEKTCGMHDLVTLANGKVVDAIFRDPKRKYTGQSTSPDMVSASQAIKEGQSRKGSAPPSPRPKADTVSTAKVLPAIVPPPAPVPPPAKVDSMGHKFDSAVAKPPAA